MPILRASFPEGYPVGPPEELCDLEDDAGLMNAISSEALPLERGEYDVTPATWDDICKFYLFVHNDTKASLMVEPLCDNTTLEGSHAMITNSEDEGMRLIATHDENNQNGRLFEVIFYSEDTLL